MNFFVPMKKDALEIIINVRYKTAKVSVSAMLRAEV